MWRTWYIVTPAPQTPSDTPLAPAAVPLLAPVVTPLAPVVTPRAAVVNVDQDKTSDSNEDIQFQSSGSSKDINLFKRTRMATPDDDE